MGGHPSSWFVLLSVVVLCMLHVNAFGPHKISKLPGLKTQPTFNQYAGYITVDQKAGRALFYWFTESQSSPSKDPLVLWLTGGPGCSSLMAFLSENGPFTPQPDGATLHYNPYSWNRVANMIWLESPAGVGFSFSNTSSDYSVGDDRTALDTYNFLQAFLKLYPQYAQRAFWITGESYGGHYVPELAYTIVKANKAGQNPIINLKGFMAGNPWTYMPIDNMGAINTWWTRGLIPQSSAIAIQQSCNMSDVGPLLADTAHTVAQGCSDAVNNAWAEMGNIDIYDIYVDVCTSQRVMKEVDKLARAGSPVHRILYKNMENKIHQEKQKRALDPCIDDHLTEYLNIAAVQQAIHAHPTAWGECSDIVDYSYQDVQKSVIPVYQYLQQNANLMILVYSGDVDGIVPYLGTRTWTLSLNRKTVEKWRPWYDSNQQVGGYVTVFDKFTFTTVRNAGHMVPWYQPQRGYEMYSNFLLYGKLP